MILIFHLQAQLTMAAKMFSKIVLINNLGFRGFMVTSGTKRTSDMRKDIN